jgi:acetoin utilization deacetylase AcuC-like enzyme
MKSPLFYCDHYDIPLPPGHKFPISKYRLLREALEQQAGFSILPADLAPIEEILRIHDEAYVRAFIAGTLDATAMRRIGFPWSYSMMQRTLCSVGGTLAATKQAVQSGFGGVLAGGTHHAFRAEGSGFCVFNDIAVAIAYLRSTHQIHKIAVIDLDVHQGDGTAAIFQDDPDVLTISLHGKNNFPFRKQESKIDVAFEDGTGDTDYLAALTAVLPKVIDFAPELIFYQAGVDPLETDSLGKMKLTFDGLLCRDRQVFQLVTKLRIPLVITLGGGYSRPISDTVSAHANTFQEASLWFD